jgi:hypothetical protein
MYVVICENLEGDPTIFAPFESDIQAQKWIDQIEKNSCPNDHYWLEADTPITEGL